MAGGETREGARELTSGRHPGPARTTASNVGTGRPGAACGHLKKHSTTFTRGRAAVARAPWLLSETWGRLDRRGPASPRGALWAAARLTINNDGIGYRW